MKFEKIQKIILGFLFILFSTSVFAHCQDFISLKKFKLETIDERLVMSMINDYKNIYHVDQNQIEDDKRKTYQFEKYLAVRFSMKNKKEVILVFDDKTQLISVVENKKVLFCGDSKK